jgi:hypothetical protein
MLYNISVYFSQTSSTPEFWEPTGSSSMAEARWSVEAGMWEHSFCIVGGFACVRACVRA